VNFCVVYLHAYVCILKIKPPPKKKKLCTHMNPFVYFYFHWRSEDRRYCATIVVLIVFTAWSFIYIASQDATNCFHFQSKHQYYYFYLFRYFLFLVKSQLFYFFACYTDDSTLKLTLWKKGNGGNGSPSPAANHIEIFKEECFWDNKTI
jgi:hypothetical protein